MEKPVRILQHVRVLDSGGIEAFIFANLRKINRDKVVFDFLVTRDTKEFYEEEVINLGGKKIVLEFKKFNNSFLNSVSQAFSFYKFCKKNKDIYRIIHFQSIGANGFFDIIAAKLAGIPYRIAHSHIAKDIKPSHNSKSEHVSTIRKCIVLFRQEIIKILVSRNATHFFGCSQMACDWMYTKRINKKQKCEVINNPIDINKFIYNEDKRNELRRKLGLEDKFVVGHVGRFVYSKNHEFLIDVFYNIKQKKENAVLFLVGEGALKDNIYKKVKNLKLEDSVYFYGATNDVFDIYNVFDTFIFPSHYEGLGIVLIEAQTNGIPVFASDTIPTEVKCVDNFKFLSLKDLESKWGEEIVNSNLKREIDNYKNVIEKGYDIKDVSRYLQDTYLNLYNNLR